MNHCRDCNSDYATPGTCNCFAPGGKRHAAPVPMPWYPYSPWWVQPCYPSYPYYGGTVIGTITSPGSASATITINNADLPLTGSSISLEGAMRQSAGWSYTVDGTC